MPVRFTYVNFPLLWDDIIAHADWDALAVIRAVERNLGPVVDREVRHLVLSPDPGNVVTVRGPTGAAQAVRDLNPDSALGAAERALCARTSVVDVRGFFHPTFDLRPLARAFPNLRVLRLTSDAEQQVTPYVPFPAEVLVLFTNPSGLGAVYEHWYFRHPSEESEASEPGDDVANDYQYEVHGRRLAPRGVARHRLPASVRRIVVNMCGDHAPPSTMWPACENPPAHVRDVVVVVPRYRTLKGEGEMSADCVDSVLAIGILEMLRAPNPRFTLVGVDEVAPDYEARLRELLRNDATEIIHADVDYSIDDPLTVDMPVQIRRYAQEASDVMRLALQENQEAAEGDTRGQEGAETAEAAPSFELRAGEQESDEGSDGSHSGVDVPAAEPEPTVTSIEEPTTTDEPATAVEAATTEALTPADPQAAAAQAGDGAPPSTPDGPAVPPSTSAVPLMGLQQKVDHLFSRIEFLTKDQYIERFGEETAALELLEYLDPSEYEEKGSDY